MVLKLACHIYVYVISAFNTVLTAGAHEVIQYYLCFSAALEHLAH